MELRKLLLNAVPCSAPMPGPAACCPKLQCSITQYVFCLFAHLLTHLFFLSPQIRAEVERLGVQEGFVNVLSRHTTTAGAAGCARSCGCLAGLMWFMQAAAGTLTHSSPKLSICTQCAHVPLQSPSMSVSRGC